MATAHEPTGATKGWARVGRAKRLAGGAALVFGAVVALSSPAFATASVSAQRLYGSTRYGTAEQIAEATFQTATIAVLASGENFPDALAAAYLAGRVHGPVLLTPTDTLAPEVVAALQHLHATGVDIVGGTAAVSASVQSTLEADGYTVSRIAGQNRDETAADVATAFPASFVGSIGSGGPTAIVASDLTFPDALSGSPIAYQASIPILLTSPTSLSSAASSALSSLGIKQVLLLGGTAAVSSTVENQIAAMGITVDRIGGADRTQTATMIADLELTPVAQGGLGWAGTEVNLARGDQFPDALAGGPRAGVLEEPVMLTESPDSLGPYTTQFLEAHAATISTIDVFGGPAAISDATVAAAQQAAS